MVMELSQKHSKRLPCGCQGCLVTIGLIMVGLIVLSLFEDWNSPHLKRKPSEQEIVGRWVIESISPTVRDWLGESYSQAILPKSEPGVVSLLSLASEGWIDLDMDGTLEAAGIPWNIHFGATPLKCSRASGSGTWKLTNVSRLGYLVHWQLAVALSSEGQGIQLCEDQKGLYLNIPLDWETSEGVMLRRTAK